jgi:hypothetical protein
MFELFVGDARIVAVGVRIGAVDVFEVYWTSGNWS